MANPDWATRLTIEPASVIPLYHQLKERLRSVCAELAPGAPVPSEKELRSYTGVGRETVRKAVSELVHEGVLVAKRGSGTYLAPLRVESALDRPVGFTESMRLLGREPSTRVLTRRLLPADAELAARFLMEPGSLVVMLERLRFVDGEPCMFEQTYLPERLVPGLIERDLDGSLYDLLAHEYRRRPARGMEVIIAVNADRQLARLLDVPIASALLRTARTSETDDGRRLEYTLRHARGDLCSFRVVLSDRSTLADRAVADALLPAGAGQ